MDRHHLLFTHFQKKSLLTTESPTYAKNISEFFLWLLKSDRTEKDITTSNLNIRKTSSTQIIAHENCLAAGLEEISYIIKNYSSLSLKLQKSDGQKVVIDEVVATLSGKTNEILSLERTILNILQRLSAIALQTKKIVNIAKTTNLHIEVAATRKTPWMLLDKKAVAVGGGLTHRLDLSDGILIKDNHLQALKDEQNLQTKSQAIQKALALIWKKNKQEFLEIEVENKEEVLTILTTKNNLNPKIPITIMLDNFKTAEIKETIKEAKNSYDTSLVLFEASGGINEENIKEFAKSGVDFLSLGSLTHSPKAIDFSLNLK